MTVAAQQLGSVYSIAVQLARPVLRGLLPLNRAYAALFLAAERTTPPQYSVEKVAETALWLMQQEFERLATARDVTEHRIERHTWRQIKRREPPNIVLRDAHDINASAGTPLDETKVRVIVAAAVRDAIAAEERRKNG